MITQNCKKGLPFPTHHSIKQTVNELRDVVVASNIALTGIFGSLPPPLSSLGLVNKIHLLVMFGFWICIFLHPIDNTLVVQYQLVQGCLNYVYIMKKKRKLEWRRAHYSKTNHGPLTRLTLF